MKHQTMKYHTFPTNRIPTGNLAIAFKTLALAATVLALVACGGSSTAPTAGTTSISGAVVKGPVDGAQVCAFVLAGNAKGSAVGACVNTDTNGNYTLNLPVDSGPLLLQATGGTYTDEATGAPTTLPVGSPLATLITATGGSVSAMLTPLTTLALNAATASASNGGTLDAAAFSAAATQLLNNFKLPLSLDINGTLPAFGAGINSYGMALTAISQMVKNGTSLATLLANSNPATLAPDFAAAAATTATPPVTPGSTAIALTFSTTKDVGVVDTSAFTPANNTLLEAYEYGRGTSTQFLTIIANASVAGSTDTNRSRRFVVQFSTLTPEVGAQFSMSYGPKGAGIQFYQFEDNNLPSPSGRLYNGTVGTVTVVARTATSITLRLNSVTLTPGLYIKGLATSGEFVADGEITAPIK